MKNRNFSLEKLWNSGIEYFLLCMMLLQLFLMIRTDFLYAEGYLELDCSLTLRHCIEMWKNGLFLPNYEITSTLETDCAMFWAAGLYLLTGKLGLSLAVSHGLTWIMAYLVLKDMGRRLSLSKAFIYLGVIVLVTPYSYGQLDWYPMLFGAAGCYAYRMLLLLLLIDVMLPEKNKTVAGKASVIFFFILDAWVSLSMGDYVLCMIFLPGFLWTAAKTVILKQREELKKKLLILIAGAGISLVFWLIGDKGFGAGSRSDIIFLSPSEWGENAKNCITGLYLLFGGSLEKIPIFSVYNSYPIFLGSCLIFTLTAVIAAGKKEDVLQSFFCVFLVDFGVLFVIKTSYSQTIFEDRYHIQWTSVMLITAVYLLMKEWGRKDVMRRILLMGGIGILIFFNWSGFKNIPLVYSNVDRLEEKEIIATTEENDIDKIYLYRETALSASLRAIDPEIEAISLVITDKGLEPMVWDDYEAIEDAKNDEKVLFFASEEEFSWLEEVYQNAFRRIGTLTDGKGIWISERNPFDFRGSVPLAPETESVDYPYTDGYVAVGTIQEDGSLIDENHEEEWILYGPIGETVPAGTYEVMIQYIGQGTDEAGKFIVISGEDGETIYGETILYSDTEEQTIEFTIDSDMVLGYWVYKNEGASLMVSKLIFERK